MAELTNKLLARQLKKLGLSSSVMPKSLEEWNLFLEKVERAYSESDNDRYTLERSLKISSREMTELYLQTQANSASLLLQERNKLNVILSNLAEGVIVLDDKGLISYLNNAAEKILDHKQDKIIGERFEKIFTAIGWKEELESIFLDKKQARIETRIDKGNGQIIPVELCYSPLPPIFEVFSGAVITVHDITKQKEVEGLLKKTTENAIKASIHKSNYLAEMSHEIRTPLNSIVSLVQLLSYTQLDETQKEDLETLESCVFSLRQMINDVLDLSKIEAGKLSLNEGNFEIKILLEKIEKQFAGLLKEKNIFFRSIIDSRINNELYGDPLRLEQILCNLVSNAIKFTPENGTITLKAINKSTDATSNLSTIEFQVQDSGVGISLENQKIIFDAFEQASTNDYKKHGGSGLGLHICKRLANLMNGTISVTSEEGRGCCFFVTLPFKNVESDNLCNKNESSQSIKQHIINDAKILLVEDNEINQNAVSRILGLKGYNVTIADNGKIALEKLEQSYFDIILMDLHMPEMDGIEATKIIRNSSNQIPIIALTAHAIQGVVDECLQAGMNSYITKPIEYPRLFKEIEKLLEEIKD